LSETHGAFARLAILFALTVGLASLSWHYLEQPFLAWKTILASNQKPATAAPVPAGQTSFA
jgi:peptidoglycan/LPS O-acetylase OafA/YrhL